VRSPRGLPGQARRQPPRPGFAPFPRHAVLRVNDLVDPHVELVAVRRALAVRGIPEGDRDVPLEGGVRALVAPTDAGVLVTLECRSSPFTPRSVVLRRLTAIWDDLADVLEIGVRGPRKLGQNGMERRSGGS
jgi:hypothetical protein